MQTVISTLNLDITSPQSVPFGHMTSAELIAELTPEDRIKYEAMEAAARVRLVAKKEQEAKEAKEKSGVVPSAVLEQESKAIAYFKKNNESGHLQVVKHIQKLRAAGKIRYEDLGGGRYTVTMPCGNKRVKMEFPPDTSLADTKYNWEYWDGEFTDPAISRDKLWSKQGQEYLEEKEKEGQKLLLKSQFQTLIDGLFSGEPNQSKILAFMMATGFYGRMALADREGDNYQRAVKCCRGSDLRYFDDLSHDSRCSLVQSTFIV